ncbi:MAG: ferric reductase-like transmembrane domain-containing protein [Sulfurospirillaceae bacterium]|nr:ferric reductase-like transmembrane domain-containing protein [Sulfurospirillaceae bacterium]
MKKKFIISIFLLLPLAYLLINLKDAIDPIKYIYIITGRTALILLMITLSASILRRVVNFMKYRKLLGLFSFFYAFLHFLNFIILGTQFDLALVAKETYEKPFVYLGMISFAVLLFMSITSTKKLFVKYHKWHRLVYIVLILLTIHASMAQKVLSWREYSYMLAAFILLSLRMDLKKRFQSR